MELKIRPMTEDERMYAYTQSIQIMAQTGCIGHLRAELDSDGPGFFSNWEDHRKYLKTEDFKVEFDQVIGVLRFDKSYGGMLQDRNTMSKYCASKHATVFPNGIEYGFRCDTEDYSYLMRLNPTKGEYNLYCYCYRKDWIDAHIKEAKRGIRFIDSSYRELFRVKDGGKVKVKYHDGKESIETCRYLDDYHLEIGSYLFHICELAEKMELGGHVIEPIDRLPQKECRKQGPVR